MKKYYLFLLFAATLTTVTMAAEAEAEAFEEPSAFIDSSLNPEAPEFESQDADPDLTPITITVNGTQVRVANACGKSLEIYNLAGVRVASFKIDSDDTTVSLNLPRGCYILKVDKVVRKAAIK